MFSPDEPTAMQCHLCSKCKCRNRFGRETTLHLPEQEAAAVHQAGVHLNCPGLGQVGPEPGISLPGILEHDVGFGGGVRGATPGPQDINPGLASGVANLKVETRPSLKQGTENIDAFRELEHILLLPLSAAQRRCRDGTCATGGPGRCTCCSKIRSNLQSNLICKTY